MENQLDYIFFVYGFSFILLSAVAWGLSYRAEQTLPWRWLALFGLLHGFNEWLDMLALSLGDGPTFKAFRLALAAASFLAMIEFARQAGRISPGRRFSPLVYLPLLVVAGIGGLGGAKGMNATCRYALGLPGCLCAGLILLSAARGMPSAKRWYLGLVALALLVYAPATGLIVPKASFFPASLLNQERFLALTGIPIQLIRALCACGTAAGLWFAYRPSREETNRNTILRPWQVPACIAMLVISGWIATEWRGQAADAEMRESILRQATAIAQTIDPEYVSQLTFTAQDKTNPSFQRLRRQLAAYGKTIQQRIIYSMIVRDGDVLFGPENLDENDPLSSPPGTKYEQPTQKNREIFRTGKPYTDGPYTDEYGTFVSAYAPIFAPRTGKVLAVIGIDVLADDWKLQVAGYRLLPVIFTLILTTVLVLGGKILEWRAHVPTGRYAWARHTEAALTCLSALVMTAAVTLLAHDSEARSRRQIFAHLAEGQSKTVRGAVNLATTQLTGFARFCQGSERVTSSKFHAYVDPLAKSASVQAFEWAPAVRAEDRTKVEAFLRSEGLPDFRIRPWDGEQPGTPAGTPPVLYPICYVGPSAGNEGLVGVDLGSEPVRRAAIDEALRTGLATATPPLQLLHTSDQDPGMLVCYPVLAQKAPNATDKRTGVSDEELKGFAVAVVHIGSMLRDAMIHSDAGPSVLDVDLHYLRSDADPRLLARLADSPEGEEAQRALLLMEWRSGLSFTCPVFTFGSVFTLVLQPSKGFLHDHPEQAGFVAGLAGLILTVCMTIVVGVLSKRQLLLEREVHTRTVALRESEESYRRQFADTRAVMLLIDPADGRILEANSAAIEFYGYPTETLHAMTIYQINTLSREALIPKVSSVLRSMGGMFRFQHRLSDGSIRDVEAYASVIRLGSRKVIHSIIHDITERILAERKLADQQLKLEQQVEERTQSLLQAEVLLHQQEKLASVGQLAAGVAHEINTPMQYVGDNLRAISDNLRDLLDLEREYRELIELVKTGAATDEKIKVIEEAEQEYDVEYLIEDTPKAISQGLEGVQRVSNIVRAMKEFSHVGRGTTSLVDINHCLESTLTVARNEYKYVADLETEFGELPEVECYAAEMNQVFLNLVVNAAHAIADTQQRGKITVKTRQVGEQVEISIGDTGTGIPEAVRRKVFDPFFTTKEVGKGTGQGLSIAQQVVVAKHQGQLTFETQEGKGTTFFIRIPVRLPEPAAEDAESQG